MECKNKSTPTKRIKPNKYIIHRYRKQISGCQDWGLWVGKMGESSQKLKTFNCKINKSWDVVYSMVTIVNNMVLHIWKFERVELKICHHKNNCNYVW